jgi:hypothetical protein
VNELVASRYFLKRSPDEHIQTRESLLKQSMPQCLPPDNDTGFFDGGAWQRGNSQALTWIR